MTELEIMKTIFPDKELSDTIRDIVRNSPANTETAYRLLLLSKDHKRDAFIIKKLSASGLGYVRIRPIIKMINN